MLEARIVGPKTDFHDFVPIEVHKRNPLFPKVLLEPGRPEHELCIPLVAWAFGNGDSFSSQAPEALGRRNDKKWMGVNLGSWDVVTKIGLKKNGLACDIQAEQFEAF